jgi:N-acetylglutamate synthase-like GNAT family acetyltransferase
MIEIISYTKKYQQDFKRLNLEWLDKYNLTESHDLEILNNPDETIIQRGGCIFLAMDGDTVIGTAGLCKEENEYELVKMAVDPAYRGQGISKNLLDKCLAAAGKLKAEKIFLFSNSQLKTALKLYEKYGFKYVDVTGTNLITADIKMELPLSY